MRLKIVLVTSAILLLGMLAGCGQKQPLDPGDSLFDNNFSFQEVQNDSLTLQSGTSVIHYGGNPYNPVGNYRGYKAKSLIKFENLSGLAYVPNDEITSVQLIFPVAKTTRDTTNPTGLAVYRYHNTWDETSDIDTATVLGYLPQPADFVDSLQYPNDADSAGQLAFSVDTSLIGFWRRDTLENHGFILEGTTKNGIVYGYSSTSTTSRPYLKVATVDSADSTIYYNIGATADLGILGGGGVPTPDHGDVVLQQSNATRMAIHFIGLNDSIPDSTAFVHSASLTIPIDTTRSYTSGNSHQLVVTQQAEGDSLLAVGTPINYSIGQSDTAVVLQDSYFRNFIQGILDQDKADQGLLFSYYQEGEGIQHLYLKTSEAKLDVILSEVQE